MALDALLDILKKAQNKYPGFSKRMVEAEALGRWEQAVGPAIARHARALRVQESVLWVEVDHPIWKSELHHRKKQILDILNGAQKDSKKSLPAAKQIIIDIFLVDPLPGQRVRNK